MVVVELDVDLLRQHIVGTDLHAEHTVARTRLSYTFLYLAQQGLDILVADVNIQLEVVAHFLLRTRRLGDETQVLDRVAATDNELVGVTLHQLDRCHIQRQVTLLAVLGFHAQRVLHCKVDTDERRERLGE